MYDARRIREKAVTARSKKAVIGPDIDLDQFEKTPIPQALLSNEDLQRFSQKEQDRLLMAGMDVTKKNRGGTYFQRNTSVVHCETQQEGVEVIPIREALAHQEWIQDYYWRLISVDTDKYTAAAELDLHDGYVIRAFRGTESVRPVQACLYMGVEGLQQTVHNILVAEEGSTLHVITGCATAPHMHKGVHVGVSEFYIKKNATLTFTMIHNWAEDMFVRPRSAAQVEEGGVFISNYICMRPVRSLQMYPTTTLTGKDGLARFHSIAFGSPGSEYDLGGRVVLQAPGTRAEIVSRAISNGGKIIARGHLIGEVPDIKAHLECRGLLLNGGTVHAIPELEGHVDGVEMSHEAAVGKIAQEEILYLMSRGLSEDEATAIIVRGFLSVEIPGLPSPLKTEIDRAIHEIDTGAL
jgi:hypothetical protein